MNAGAEIIRVIALYSNSALRKICIRSWSKVKPFWTNTHVKLKFLTLHNVFWMLFLVLSASQIIKIDVK